MSSPKEPCNGSEDTDGGPIGSLGVKDGQCSNAYTYNEADTMTRMDTVGMCQTRETKSCCKEESLKSDINSDQTSIDRPEKDGMPKEKMPTDTIHRGFPNATTLGTGKRNLNSIVALLKKKCGNGQSNLNPVVTLRDIMRDLNLWSDMQNNGIKLSWGTLKIDSSVLQSNGSKVAKNEKTGLQYSFFSSVVLASSIRSPEESLRVRSKPQMAGRRQAMDRTQRKENTEHCERRDVGFEKFDPSDSDSKIQALISSAVSSNSSFFENASSLYGVSERRRDLNCGGSKAGILKHAQNETEEINAGLLLSETTCKKYALRKKTLIQYNRENSFEQIDWSAFCKDEPNSSTATDSCQDYSVASRLHLKSSLFDKNLKSKCKGSRKMLVKIAKLNLQKYWVQTERKTKVCQKLLTPNNLSAGVRVHSLPAQGQSVAPTPAAKKGRRSKVAVLPTGEMPVVIKRKRGRPRKVLPEGTSEPPNHVKRKPRHHKLSPPQPSYIAGSNDSATDYADVLSKLAFLTKQSLILGRCSPPRCWSPSDPGSFHRSASVHQDMSQFYRTLAGTRRRGGKAGCPRGRQIGQLTESSTFSDFFEGIGKKKRIFLGETKLHARKCKWGTEMREKPVQRRKPYKRAAPCPEQGGRFQGTNPDNAEWARQGDSCWTASQGYASGKQQVRNGLYPSYSHLGAVSTQSFPTAAGWEPSSSGSRNGYFVGRVSSGQGSVSQGSVSQQSPGCIAGYFRSLLDSDDSSDLMDPSFSQGQESSCGIGGGAYGSSNSTQASRQAPHYPESFEKTSSPSCSGGQQHLSQMGQAYPLMIADNSDAVDFGSSYSSDTETFQRIAPQPSLSRHTALSCQQPSGSYCQYSGYRAKAQNFSGSEVTQPTREYPALDFLGNRDCTYGYDASNNGTSGPGTSADNTYGQRGIGTSLHFSKASPSFNSLRADRSPHALHSSLTCEGHSDAVCSMDHVSQKYFSSLQAAAAAAAAAGDPTRVAYARGLQLSCKSGFNLCDGNTACFSHHYNPVLDYHLNESKDILDISNYTPQKVKQRPFPEAFGPESSSAHFSASFDNNSDAAGGPCGNLGAEEKSSLSSLEKLMMDWDETTPIPKAGARRQWNHHIPFPSDSKGAYGRRRRVDVSSPSHLAFPSSPPFPARKAATPRQPRNTRSPCASGKKELSARKSKQPPRPQGTNPVFSESSECSLDYGFGGDSSRQVILSHPPNFNPQKSEQKEYCGLYPSAGGCSTPLPDDAFPQRFPGNDIQEAVSMFPDLKPSALEAESFQSPPGRQRQQLSAQTLPHSVGHDPERLLADSPGLFGLPTSGYGDNLPSSEGKKHPAFYDSLDNSTGSDAIPSHSAPSGDLALSQLQYDTDSSASLETNARYLQNSGPYGSLDESRKEAEMSLLGMQGRNHIIPSIASQIIHLNHAVAQIDKETQKLGLEHMSSAYSAAAVAAAAAGVTGANASPASSSDSSLHVDNNYSDVQGNHRQATLGLLLDQNLVHEVYTGGATQ